MLLCLQNQILATFLLDCSIMAQLVIVTGASRGLGRSIAIAFAKSNQTSCFVLVGRNAIDLEITKSRLVENQVPDTHIHLLPVDLSNMDHLGEYSDSMFDSKIFGKSGFESIIFVNNAATIGKLEVSDKCLHFL